MTNDDQGGDASVWKTGVSLGTSSRSVSYTHLDVYKRQVLQDVL